MQGIAAPVDEFCRKLLSHMMLQLTVEVAADGDAMVVNLGGADRPLLLSNSAALLNSLEYLVNRVFRAGADDKGFSILFDSENYRRHREAELTLLAKMASQRVISQRKPLELQPMTPRERRIVHLALAAIEGVRSESSGTGENRSVTIYPSG